MASLLISLPSTLVLRFPRRCYEYDASANIVYSWQFVHWLHTWTDVIAWNLDITISLKARTSTYVAILDTCSFPKLILRAPLKLPDIADCTAGLHFASTVPLHGVA